MFERYSCREYKKLLVCTSMTDVEWACPLRFENLPLLLPSYSHFAQQDCNLCDSCLYPLQLAVRHLGQTSGVQVIIIAPVVVQKDHCPSPYSVYFIVRRFGLENAFQNCYITPVTGTDVDSSSV